MEIKYKQYIILNKSLNMSIGKSCAMTAHASYLALREQEKKNKTLINKWLKNGECVIVLEAYTSTQMFGLQQYLNRKEIINHIYIDEGLTEVPMGEPTVLATGVLTEEESEWLSTMNMYGNEQLDDLAKKMNGEINKDINKKVYGIDSDQEMGFGSLFVDKKEIHPIFGKLCERCGNAAILEEWSPDGPKYYYCSDSCKNKYHSEQNSKGIVWRCTEPTSYKFVWGKEPILKNG